MDVSPVTDQSCQTDVSPVVDVCVTDQLCQTEDEDGSSGELYSNGHDAIAVGHEVVGRYYTTLYNNQENVWELYSENAQYLQTNGDGSRTVATGRPELRELFKAVGASGTLTRLPLINVIGDAKNIQPTLYKKYNQTIVKPGMVVGFCNPLLDMTVVGNHDLLVKYGLKSNDVILAGEKQRGLYEELEKDPNIQYTVGGSGQNSLRVVQWILGARKSATFFGAVGNDQYSEVLEREANRDGLDVKYQHHSDKPTGTCAVIITNGGKDRSLCANLSASRCYTDDHLELPENKEILENAQFYLVTKVEHLLRRLAGKHLTRKKLQED
ncbi:adenosine kinase-like [Melanaphis sacchari]|uniref:adenosine kinase-like n=1 Tax=Melanaphis sacchari TaxID=742174 RepID=UPI000DC138FE|nr:adenosine kinase-like [Melanaphis sacchari]